MHLKIKLAVPNGKLLVILEISLKELRRRRVAGRGHCGELREAVHKLDHLLGGSAAAVAVTEHLQSLAADILILISLPIRLYLARHIPVNEMGRGHAGAHL